MLVGPHLRPDNLSLIRVSVERLGLEGEEMIAVLGLVRVRSRVSTLVVTTRRLLTLGRAGDGFPVLELFAHDDVLGVHVERDSLLAQGHVRVRTAEQTRLLGALTPPGEARTYDIFERALEQAEQRRRRGPGPGPAGADRPESGQPVLPGPRMQTIPVPGAPLSGAQDGPVQDDMGQDDVGESSAAPLVAQLAELAGLHQDGALTDEEFSRAKARLLGGEGTTPVG